MIPAVHDRAAWVRRRRNHLQSSKAFEAKRLFERNSRAIWLLRLVRAATIDRRP